MTEKRIVSLMYKGATPQPPKVKVGTQIQSIFSTPQGPKMSKGVVIANNIIDFVTLTALYTIETENLDEDGKKIIIEYVPESFFM